jgi:hypothetical protein
VIGLVMVIVRVLVDVVVVHLRRLDVTRRIAAAVITASAVITSAIITSATPEASAGSPGRGSDRWRRHRGRQQHGDHRWRYECGFAEHIEKRAAILIEALVRCQLTHAASVNYRFTARYIPTG